MAQIEASCLVERLREAASFNSAHAVQVMPPPSYLSTLMDVSDDIVLIYKVNTQMNTSSLPLDVRDDCNSSFDSSIELEGNPLPAPFKDEDDLNVSISERKQCQWPKAELNHFPLKLNDALNVLNKKWHSNDQLLDIWCLVDCGISQKLKENEANLSGRLNGLDLSNGQMASDADVSKICLGPKLQKNVKILIGSHATKGWWTRSSVEAQGVCSIASPQMDPQKMKKDHLALANMPDSMVSVKVSCRYTISGHTIIYDPTLQISSYDTPSSVSLGLQWRQLSVSVPLQEASTKVEVLVQAAVGHPASPAHGLWRQLCLLQKLIETLLSSWRDKSSPEGLPHLEPSSEDPADESKAVESLENRIRTLLLGGGHAKQVQSANSRMSIAPSLMGRQSGFKGRDSAAPRLIGRQSMAPGFLGRRSIAPQAIRGGGGSGVEEENQHLYVSLNEAVESAVSATRDNTDVTDLLWSLFTECKTYRELVQAWDLLFMELHELSVKPFIRPKNNSRVVKLIQGLVSGQVDSCPDFLQIEGSLYPLELLIEIGLEKLTTDYTFIFLESLSVGRDELQPPQLVRAGLGVSRDKWLGSCGQSLGWLAQVHTALEVLLPLQSSLKTNTFPVMASKALKFYQSEASPVHSVAGLLLPGKFLQDFSVEIPTDVVRDHLTEKFDWWKMTLSSDDEMRKVSTSYLRSYLHPIFPPQLYDGSETLLSSEGVENVQYYCAQATTHSIKLPSC